MSIDSPFVRTHPLRPIILRVRCAACTINELNAASDDGSDVGDFGFGLLDPYGSSDNDDERTIDEEDNESPRSPQQRPSSVSTSPQRSPVPVGSPGSPRPVRYWARRIHRFLLSVRELRAVPDRDPGSLDKIMRRLF